MAVKIILTFLLCGNLYSADAQKLTKEEANAIKKFKDARIAKNIISPFSTDFCVNQVYQGDCKDWYDGFVIKDNRWNASNKFKQIRDDNEVIQIEKYNTRKRSKYSKNLISLKLWRIISVENRVRSFYFLLENVAKSSKRKISKIKIDETNGPTFLDINGDDIRKDESDNLDSLNIENMVNHPDFANFIKELEKEDVKFAEGLDQEVLEAFCNKLEYELWSLSTQH